MTEPRETRKTTAELLADLAEAGVFVSPWMLLSEAAASVELDRKDPDRVRTYSLDDINLETEVEDEQ